jgi:bacterioferritin
MPALAENKCNPSQSPGIRAAAIGDSKNEWIHDGWDHFDGAKSEFLQNANEEQQHIDWIATRITQLNGEPNFNPDGLVSGSHSEYTEGINVISMLKEDLYAERIAIESYSEIVRWLGDPDSTTRKLMVDIFQVEEEHTEDLKTLLEKIS